MRPTVPLLLAALLSAAPAAQAQSRVGSWTVYTQEIDCYVASEWSDKKTKYSLWFGYRAGGADFFLRFTDSTLKVPKQVTVDATVRIDKNAAIKASGLVDSAATLFAFNAASPIVGQIRQGNAMTIDFRVNGDDVSYDFTLEDTNAAIGALQGCKATAG